jgi:NTP pyrophosphatase (non-canonical NTP hydrolase)
MSFNMNHAEEFRNKFKCPNDKAQRTTQKFLIVEEFKEFLEAENQLISGDFRRNEADCLKELGDLVYVCFQFAAYMEWDLDHALMLIHESNLSKLGHDGKPIYRSDGKVLKGPNYQPPNLIDCV